MIKEYYTLKKNSSVEIVIQKSRFICDIFKVDTESGAIEKLTAVKKKYSDATHHCYAYSVGLETAYKRHSDDGEPSGTAGMPILSVIDHNGLRGVLAVVTRYFGGTKLGAGGLVRAYSKACSEAVASAEKIKMTSGVTVEVIIDYSFFNQVERFLRSGNDTVILNADYGANINLKIVTCAARENIEKEISNICGGAVIIKKTGEMFFHFPG